MDLSIPLLSSYSIVVPAAIAFLNLSRLNTSYRPYLYFIIAGFFSELLCQIYLVEHRPFFIVLNVYWLFQAYYITWQFKNWGLFKNYDRLYWILQVFFSLVWFFENIFVDSSKYILSYFVIVSNYIMAIMSISIINKLVIKVHGSLWKNPVFVICMGWLVLFTFSVLSEVFFKYSLAEPAFAARIYSIVQVINIFTNIIFGIAILWIPSKPKFILPS